MSEPAKCAHPGPVPCAHHTCAAHCWVVADQGYAAAAPDRLACTRVVCPMHGHEAKLQPEQTPVAYRHKVSTKLLELWLYRAGYKSRAQCAICVNEELCLRHLNVAQRRGPSALSTARTTATSARARSRSQNSTRASPQKPQLLPKQNRSVPASSPWRGRRSSPTANRDGSSTP